MLRVIFTFIRDLLVLIGFCAMAAAAILGCMILTAGWQQ